MFSIATHAAISGQEYLIAALIGLLAGLASGALTTLVYACEDFFKKLPVHWMWWPAIGAVVVGIGGYFEPRVLGVGYDTIHGLLRGEIIGPVIIGLLVGKAIVWSVALGSGTSGGILAPLLIIGSALGAALAPHLPGGDTGLWALIGMAGMMAGMMNAPLTATVFVVELTRDYNVLPAALLASAVALGVTVLLLRRSILTEKLARRGQHITREYAVDVFELTRVQDVMDRNPPTVPATLTVAELSARLARGEPELTRRQGTLLLDQDNLLAGIITRGDIVRALAQPEKRGLTVAEAGCAQLVVTYPDEPLQAALATMLKHNIGRLPVVDREAPRRLLGYLGRTAILSARHRWHEEEEVRQRF
jgi:CBS domain-containing protein